RAVPRLFQPGACASSHGRGDAGLSLLADGGGAHRPLQSGDAPHRRASQPGYACLLALEHVAPYRTRAAAVSPGSRGGGTTPARAAAGVGEIVHLYRSRLLYSPAKPPVAPLPAATDDRVQKRGAA